MEVLWAAILAFIHSIELLLPQADLVYLAALFGALAAILPFYRRISNSVYKNYIEPVGKFFSTFATLPERLESLEKSVDAKITKMQAEHYRAVEEIRKEIGRAHV
jgi:hypothetical protein